MNIKHLGDALDYWKWCVLFRLRKRLRDLHVVPMFTDVGISEVEWGDAQLSYYARFLRVTKDRVLLQATRFTNEDREAYFSNPVLNGAFDLFIDPDNGLEPKCDPCDHKHVKINEINALLRHAPERLCLVYQHSHKMNKRESIRKKLLQFPVQWNVAAYWCGEVSMVFVSYEKQRIESIRTTLASWIGPCLDGAGGVPHRLL